jgi:hypothetical protein
VVVDILMSYEGANLGLTFGTLREDPFSFADMLGMMLLDTVIYAVLAWYEMITISYFSYPSDMPC